MRVQVVTPEIELEDNETGEIFNVPRSSAVLVTIEEAGWLMTALQARALAATLIEAATVVEKGSQPS